MTVDRSHKGLTRQAVVRAALELVEDGGLERLSMRAVAARLGASPMSVYNHAADREDLLVAMLEAALADLPFIAHDADPVNRVRIRYRNAHDYLAERTWVLRVLIEGDLIAINTFVLADACIGDFLAAGLSPVDAIYSHGLAWQLMLGELLDCHPEPPKRTPTQRELALRTMDVSDYPNYALVLSVLDQNDMAPRCQFDRSLGHLLTGVVADLT